MKLNFQVISLLNDEIKKSIKKKLKKLKST